MARRNIDFVETDMPVGLMPRLRVDEFTAFGVRDFQPLPTPPPAPCSNHRSLVYQEARRQRQRRTNPTSTLPEPTLTNPTPTNPTSTLPQSQVILPGGQASSVSTPTDEGTQGSPTLHRELLNKVTSLLQRCATAWMLSMLGCLACLLLWISMLGCVACLLLWIRFSRNRNLSMCQACNNFWRGCIVIFTSPFQAVRGMIFGRFRMRRATASVNSE